MSKTPALSLVAAATAKAVGIQLELFPLAHAKLGASGSKKWLICPPSANLEAQFPNTDTKFSSEGTFGHAVFEHRLNIYLGRTTKVPFENLIEGHAIYWSQELSDSVDAALERAIERIEYARSVCKDPMIMLEARLNYSAWVPEGFGTGDLVIITDTYIEVLDLKMGSGVPVAAFENSQFRLYMLGAYHQFGDLYGVTKMRGTVLQPRLNNYSSEEIEVADLLLWADTVVVPAAKLAYVGEGDFVAGEHCSSGFCKARFNCTARAKANMAIAQADFALADPELMTDAQIIQVLDKAEAAIKWLGDVQSYALTQAERGHKFEGFKLVEGRSNRKYSDPDAVATALTQAGVPEALIYERALLGVTAMEKAIGKKKFAEVLNELIVKPSGKPTLVPVTDKREEMSLSAAADFS